MSKEMTRKATMRLTALDRALQLAYNNGPECSSEAVLANAMKFYTFISEEKE